MLTRLNSLPLQKEWLGIRGIQSGKDLSQTLGVLLFGTCVQYLAVKNSCPQWYMCLHTLIAAFIGKKNSYTCFMLPVWLDVVFVCCPLSFLGVGRLSVFFFFFLDTL